MCPNQRLDIIDMDAGKSRIEFIDNTDALEAEERLEKIIQFDNHDEREQNAQLLSEGRENYAG